MTHNELLAKINSLTCCSGAHELALLAVVELHKPMWDGEYCGECHPDHNGKYPCPTIKAIEKEL